VEYNKLFGTGTALAFSGGIKIFLGIFWTLAAALLLYGVYKVSRKQTEIFGSLRELLSH